MYEQQIEFAKTLAYKAGGLIRQNFIKIGSSEKTWKEDNSPLTLTDTTINRMVLEAIEKEFPEHSLLGEEESSNEINTEFVWICDPIDGTIPFSHGWPTSCFSLALCKEGAPVVGIVYDPYMDRLYTGETGMGSFVNGHALKVSTSSDWTKNYIGINFWHGAPYDFAEAIPEMHKNIIEMMNLGSAVYMSSLVANGNLLAYVFSGKSPWDIAAIKVIVEEAGGKVTNIFGDDQRYDRPIKGAIVSNSLVHEKLVKILKPYIVNK